LVTTWDVRVLFGDRKEPRESSREPQTRYWFKPALARARQEEASVTDFHASMDVRLDAHSDRPDRVGHRESAMHDRAILITPLGEQLPRPCHKPLALFSPVGFLLPSLKPREMLGPSRVVTPSVVWWPNVFVLEPSRIFPHFLLGKILGWAVLVG